MHPLTLPLHSWPGDVSSARHALLALHGFTGDGLDFEALAAQLNTPLCAPDLPGHGLRDPDAEPAHCASGAVIKALHTLVTRRPQPPILLGYSMGGRYALHYALRHADTLSGLVLISASPGIMEPQEREARQRSDEAMADALLTPGGLEAFLLRWQQSPFIATQARAPQPYRGAREARRHLRSARGLASSLRGFGQGVMPHCWDELGALRLPTLLITGEEDSKYNEIARTMSQRIPQAQRVVIAGAGHAPHLEVPAVTAGTIASWLVGR